MGFWVNNFEADISGSHTSPAQHGVDTHATHQRQGGVGVHRKIVPVQTWESQWKAGNARALCRSLCYIFCIMLKLLTMYLYAFPVSTKYLKDAFCADYLANWCLVVVGGVAGYFAWRTLKVIQTQAEAMKVQTDIAIRGAENAEKAAEFARLSVTSVERADVLLQESSFVFSLSGRFDDYAMPRFIFKNFGRTRASEVSHHIVMSIEGGQIVYEPITITTEGTVLAGGQEQTVIFPQLNKAFSPKTLIRIESGASKLNFSGTTTFNDVFGSKHFGQYSGTYDPSTHTFNIDESRSSHLQNLDLSTIGLIPYPVVTEE